MPSLSISEQSNAFQYLSAATSRFGDVAGGNYAEFENDGTLAFYGNATTWRDFNFGVNALARGASAPDLVSLSGTSIQVLGFDGINTTEQVSVVLEMDHMWKEGSVIYPHLHWYPTTSGVGNVKWQLEYVTVQDGLVVGASATLSVVVAAGGVAWRQAFTDFPPINLAGYTIESQFHARLFRNPGDGDDTYAADAAVATFGLHVEQDMTGSRAIRAK